MAENDESKMQRVKNRITKMHDKLQSRVEDIYEDIQETVHLASPRVNRFVSHLSKSDKIKKSESSETISARYVVKPESSVERSTSLEDFQRGTIEEPWQKLRLSSKIKILKQMLKKSSAEVNNEAEESDLKLSTSEINLLKKELFANEDDGDSLKDDDRRSRRGRTESKEFESDEFLVEAPSETDSRSMVVEDEGVISDSSSSKM